ncbi:cell division protein ZapA [Fulvimarina manganoxydans]|uniref:Cell division protein ZapA n=1 Tax=Fulvimarina manganoxydans TaxID=937218 RepID=A0A1W2DN36_9HYPH|nr:cell division protein ZapA [Fulvimarina manganoxydans]MCK5931102.1 cell division protein ZapA [Fulvimarina manganoxydans]MEE2952646.1 cell division protein ZapA [Pseudomonadota bacterium]SMC98839.1 cell division protein ZapA [Fulvimarina manganoxydans]
MPQVVVTIDGKTYRMACGPGEEEHLQGLAADIEGKIASLKDDVGQIGDQRLTIMAAIMTADELSDARQRIAALEAESETLRGEIAAAEAGRAADRSRFLRAMDEAALFMERLTARLGSGL